jgi:hypothetical protein
VDVFSSSLFVLHFVSRLWSTAVFDGSGCDLPSRPNFRSSTFGFAENELLLLELKRKLPVFFLGSNLVQTYRVQTEHTYKYTADSFHAKKVREILNMYPHVKS